MPFSDFMNKVRQWDTQAARWMMRHFYILFFEFVLVVIFFVFLFSTFHTIDIAHDTSKDNIVEQLLVQQNTGTDIIIILMLLALKSGLTIVAVGLLVILIFTSKSKWLLMATAVGGGLALIAGLGGINSSLDNPVTLAVLAGLFLILLILARSDSENPAPQSYMPGAM